MKLSVSLPTEDVEFLDAYVATCGLPSRSAAVHKAVRLLAAADLGAEYAEAWGEWTASGDAQLWDTTVPDGLTE